MNKLFNLCSDRAVSIRGRFKEKKGSMPKRVSIRKKLLDKKLWRLKLEKKKLKLLIRSKFSLWLMTKL